LADIQLLAGKGVLVVEDEMLVLMAIEDMLADLGCTFVAATGNVRGDPAAWAPRFPIDRLAFHHSYLSPRL